MRIVKQKWWISDHESLFDATSSAFIAQYKALYRGKGALAGPALSGVERAGRCAAEAACLDAAAEGLDRDAADYMSMLGGAADSAERDTPESLRDRAASASRLAAKLRLRAIDLRAIKVGSHQARERKALHKIAKQMYHDPHKRGFFGTFRERYQRMNAAQRAFIDKSVGKLHQERLQLPSGAARGHGSQGQGGGGAGQRSGSSDSDGSGSGDPDPDPEPPRRSHASGPRADLLKSFGLPLDFDNLETARDRIKLVAQAYLATNPDLSLEATYTDFAGRLRALGGGLAYSIRADADFALISIEQRHDGWPCPGTARQAASGAWGGSDLDRVVDHDALGPLGNLLRPPTDDDHAGIDAINLLAARIDRSEFLPRLGRGPAQRLGEEWLDAGCPGRADAPTGASKHLKDRLSRFWRALALYLIELFGGKPAPAAFVKWLRGGEA